MERKVKLIRFGKKKQIHFRLYVLPKNKINSKKRILFGTLDSNKKLTLVEKYMDILKNKHVTCTKSVTKLLKANNILI